MRKLHTVAKELTTALAMREVYRGRALYKAQYRYYMGRVKQLRGEYNKILKAKDGQDFHPEQKPLFVDDIPWEVKK